jgi:hypothetical protein
VSEGKDPAGVRAERLAYLREQLAALESYSNGQGQRAAAVRAEIGLIEAQHAAAEATRELTEARQEAADKLGDIGPRPKKGNR